MLDSIVFSNRTLNGLTYLAKVKGQSIQKVAEKFIQEAIEYEEDIALAELSIKRNTSDVETVDYENVKWRC